MKTAYLALGSNLGNRIENLAAAVRQLAAGGLRLRASSSVYETEPFGVMNQPDYLNSVLEIETDLRPEKLLVRCLEIETSLGRVRLERWGPRTIDVDMLWFDDTRILTPDLTVPHPRMLERAFVLIPLAEIAPQLVLLGETVAARAAAFGPLRIRKLNAESSAPYDQALHHERAR